MSRFRPAMGWLHNWMGLLLGWLLFAIFVTGSFGYYRHEVTLFMTPELRPLAAATVSQEEASRRAVTWLSANAAKAESWSILLPDEKSPAIRVSWDGETTGEQLLDPRSGAPLDPAPRATGGGDFLYRLHSDLHFVSPMVGRILVTFIGVALLVLLVTGLVTHRNILRNLLRFRPGKGWRTRLDLHNLAGVLGLPFHLFVTLTGLVTVMMLIQPWGVASVYGASGLGAFAQDSFPSVRAQPPRHATAPATLDLAPLIGRAKHMLRSDTAGEIDIEKPGVPGMRVSIAHPIRGIVQFRKPSITFDPIDGTVLGTTNNDLSSVSLMHSQLFGLHVAHFAGPVMRFVLFCLGLVGAAMVATGHLLWAAKRWPKADAKVPHSIAAVDRLNAAVFAGLPLAIATYLWSNRLIPADLAGRAAEEQTAMFAAWGVALVVACIAPARLVWTLLLAAGGLAAAALGGLDLAGQWPVWLIDLILLTGGLALLAAAIRSFRVLPIPPRA
ncbi:MAG: PepSY-associated TM helix domain-containing protein [Candidatus Andeanibacterium colombiense]|uniref:PepSY-associated TM helix domain-containing protein n=1 Tax=Candidatus Andeanibacterium colombiense TaxID=3121345 RepID=A0AAJ6BNT5_9SPHN|nr:MAG: PepSY-associated TM helix domain-containing protein [Sphingomonadaceae bacterium]